MSNTYKDAGVDIDAGNELVKKIGPMAKSTSRTGSDVALGGFGGLFDLKACGYKDPVLVAANDGVGTKLHLAFASNLHKTVGIDLVAMCVNDLIVQGAEPLFFLDYFATGKLDNHVATDVIEGIAEGCKQSGCALIGGETAEMPGMYQAGHYDLAGFSVGAVERDQILPKPTISEGDVVIGLASSGVHSNGFSLVRHLISQQGLNFEDASPFSSGQTLAESLLTPTKIYVKPVLEVIKQFDIKGLVHITGGGFTENIPRVLPDNLGVTLDYSSWSTPDVFGWLATIGNIASDEMLRTFNCGIGMTLICPSQQADEVCAALNRHDVSACVIGSVNANQGQQVVIHNAESI